MEIKDIPKIVLHIHLDGSLDLDLAYKWLREDGYNYSFSEALEKLRVDKGCRSLNQYLEKFDLPCKLLNNYERLKEASKSLFLKLEKEGVVYAEVRFAPIKHVNDNLNINRVVEAVLDGMNEVLKNEKMYGGIILCCMRDASVEDNLKIVSLAKKYSSVGVVGIDLAGAEALYETKNFKYIFDKAKEENIRFTIHAGEADGISSIKSALEFGTSRLGHGIKAIEDDEMIEKLKKENILLEVCVTSNYQTEAVKGIHPIEELYKKGIKISINTDNDTVSGIDIISEYKYILENTNLKIEDIIKCNYNSIDFIFNDKSKRQIKKIFK